MIKEFIELYKSAKSLADDNRQLLLKDNTFNPKTLEEVIQAVNENPQLRAEIRLVDGSVLSLKTVSNKTENQTSRFYEAVGFDEDFSHYM